MSRAVARRVAQTGDAEVEHLHLTLARQEKVRGLDVAVDDAPGVRCGEHVEQLIGDRQHGAHRQAPVVLLPHLLDARAVQQFHHQERRTVLGHAVVGDLDCALVLDRVADVALPQETRPDVFADGQLWVEHLDRAFVLVPVGCRVDDGHAANPEDAIDPVAALQHRTDASPRAVDEVRLAHRTLNHGNGERSRAARSRR